MARRQIPFVLADHELLAGASVRSSRLFVKGQSFSVLVLPAGINLPPGAAEQVDRFKAGGGTIVRGSDGVDWSRFERRVSAAGDHVVLGCFLRDRREILLIVNTGSDACNPVVAAPRAGHWLIADPARGRIEPPATDGNDKIRINLTPQSALLLIGPVRLAPRDGG